VTLYRKVKPGVVPLDPYACQVLKRAAGDRLRIRALHRAT